MEEPEGADSRRWLVVGALLLALVLVPFAFFGGAMETLAARVVEDRTARTGLALGAAALLALDLVLPVPSSLLSTATGAVLGARLGTSVSALGMTVGCLAGYLLGRRYGRALTRRIVGQAQLERADAVARHVGDWVVVALRAVPVLAEASVFLAGVNRMAPMRFVALAALSNLGISAVYAAAGARGAAQSMHLSAFAAAVALPAAGVLLVRAVTSRARRRPARERAGRMPS